MSSWLLGWKNPSSPLRRGGPSEPSLQRPPSAHWWKNRLFHNLIWLPLMTQALAANRERKGFRNRYRFRISDSHLSWVIWESLLYREDSSLGHSARTLLYEWDISMVEIKKSLMDLWMDRGESIYAIIVTGRVSGYSPTSNRSIGEWEEDWSFLLEMRCSKICFRVTKTGEG